MSALTLDTAKTIIITALAKARADGLKPLGVVVLDAGGHVKAFEREDGASNFRFEMARAKAYGSLGLGMGSRAIYNRAEKQHYFVTALNGVVGGGVLPVPGGALIKDGEGEIVGAVGASGDTSDADEACIVAGIEAAGFTAQVD